MEITQRRPTHRGPAEWFTGEVAIDPIVEPDDRSARSVLSVHFHPGARTAWHTHVGGQILYVTEGEGLVQARGGPIERVRVGDVIRTPSMEWHWHGATAHHAMTHLSITDGAPTFGAHVTDGEYLGESAEPPHV